MFSAATKTGSQPSAAANYIEDVFSTYLYTGNDSTQTINNGIDLAGKGGMLWLKQRSGAQSNWVSDTVCGNTKVLYTNRTDAQQTVNNNPGGLTFNSNGFSLDGNPFVGFSNSNESGQTYASWTFRKQPKFFDIVTYTGNGANRTISHNLGSIPGMIIVKRTDTTSDWQVYHSALANTEYMVLNTTAAKATGATRWNSTTPTSSVFSIGTDTTVNASGGTYVAYIYASNAGGFGTSGTDNVISCGSFTTDGSGNATVNLGYEPQFLLIKKSSSGTQDWHTYDVMRGFNMTSTNLLRPNTSGAESVYAASYANPTATGFNIPAGAYSASETFIYMAIRRPMKVPTDATTVFIPVSTASASNPLTVTTGFPVDLSFSRDTSGSAGQYVVDRLRGNTTTSGVYLTTQSTAAEVSQSGYGIGLDNNTAIIDNGFNAGASNPKIYWNFSRRPGFFDVVCYTGDGTSSRDITHNLTVLPEIVITKPRSGIGDWKVYEQDTPSNASLTLLNSSNKFISANLTGGYVAPTSSTLISVNAYSSSVSAVNASGTTYVAYLFATCPGVSKVGSYTGNGTTQAIACGFTGGARFVLIKCTDSTGDWYTYDTARGMTTLTDPYLLLNSTAAQSATLGSVTTTTGGFTVNASILSAINTSGASYIFLAIA